MGVNNTSGPGTPRDAARGASDREEDVSLLWLVGVMLRERRLILLFAAIGAALSLSVGLLRDRTWTATFSFVPQAGKNPAAGLASLAGQFGVSLSSLAGDQQPPEFYADLLLTREVLAPIVAEPAPSDRSWPRIRPRAFFAPSACGSTHRRAARASGRSSSARHRAARAVK